MVVGCLWQVGEGVYSVQIVRCEQRQYGLARKFLHPLLLVGECRFPLFEESIHPISS